MHLAKDGYWYINNRHPFCLPFIGIINYIIMYYMQLANYTVSAEVYYVSHDSTEIGYTSIHFWQLSHED